MNLKKLEKYLRVNLLGPGPRLMKTKTKKKKIPGRGLTKVENHCSSTRIVVSVSGEPGHNDLGLCNTLATALHISVVPTNSPLGTCFSALLSTTHIRASTSDITTLPVTGSNIIFQEV